MNGSVEQYTPQELKKKIGNDEVVLIDVRESREWNYCKIEGAELIPVREIQNADIPTDDGKDIVLYCHTGQRSYFAAQVLQSRGFENVYNLQGGIDAYAREVDPDIPRY
jgi:sulfur-carrier protein adenylyltransferase/sulfurtransferase